MELDHEIVTNYDIIIDTGLIVKNLYTLKVRRIVQKHKEPKLCIFYTKLVKSAIIGFVKAQKVECPNDVWIVFRISEEK